MSIIVAKSSLTPKQEAFLLKESKVKELRSNFNPFPKTYKLYQDRGQDYICPRAIGIPGKTWQQHYSLPDYKVTFTVNGKLFTGTDGDNPDLDNPVEQRRDQKTTVELGLQLLRERGYAFYNFSTGYGKTKCAIETIRQLGRRALIVAFNEEIQKQTYLEIKQNSTAKVFWYNSHTKKTPPDDAQIVICGLIKATRQDINFLASFQTLVLDECDQTAAKSYFPLFLKCCPTYLLGLTATLKKSNGLESVLYKYFGPKDQLIYRFIEKPNSKVIKFQTNFVPNVETSVNVLGQLQINQHEINKSLAENPERNRMIMELVHTASQDGQCLVLSPRTENIVWIATQLEKRVVRGPRKRFEEMMKEHLKPKWKELLDGRELKTRAEYIIQWSRNSALKKSAADYLVATSLVDYKTVGKKSINKTSRILIGGFQSCGRGFDCKAKYLFLLGIPPNLTQFIGRLRDPNGTVYIFVDKYAKFESDWLKKSMPYLRKLGCQLFFQNQGSSDVQPYAVPKGTGRKVERESILDDVLGE